MTADSIFDLAGPKTWEEYNWQGMPGFQHQDLEPKRSIVVHFANDADVATFAKLVEQKISPKTRSLWYPQAEIGHFTHKVYVAETAPVPRYPIYVISKGRWESRLTIRSLDKLGLDYRVVVEPQERDRYAAVIDPEKILTLPFSNLGQGSIPARNWVWGNALEAGALRHWILDDNIDGFFYYQDNLKTPVGDGTTFVAIENYVNQYENVALAGMQYFMFVSRKSGNISPITLNTRIYSCILIDCALPYRWRGCYNEDTDLSLRALKDGRCTVLFNAFLAMKQTTMTMKGGNTDELYKDGGRLKMAESLQEQHPDVVTITEKWGRPQHHVNYSNFKFNRLVLKPDAETPDLDILNLKILEKSERVVTEEPVAIEPIRLTPKLIPTAPPSTESAAPYLAQLAPVVLAPRGLKITSTTTLSAESEPKSTPYVNPFLAFYAATLRAAGVDRIVFDEEVWDHAVRNAVGLDVECFENFFLVCLKRFADGKRMAFELSERSTLDVAGLRAALNSNLIVTFNGTTYDLPMVHLALAGADCAKLKIASDRIIKGNMKPWDVKRELGVRVPRLNHIDLMEPNPSVRQSLKALHGRLHGRFIVGLPFAPEARLSPEQMNVATLYCMNDLDATEGLYAAMLEPTKLRVALGREYGMDFRSKSDAQIGEAIVIQRVEQATKRRVQKNLVTDLTFHYDPASFIRFESETLSMILDNLRRVKFHVVGGKVQTPPELEREVQIGEAVYSMGIGGLHSQEAHRALHSDDEYVLIDIDVTGHYPSIIRKLGLYPPALGPAFLEVANSIVEEREIAKVRQKDLTGDDAVTNKSKIDGLKIVANGGLFGKLGSAYSPIFAPHLLIATTVTGQLSILMLIERVEQRGISVISANTDGVTLRCPRALEATLDALVVAWEAETGFGVEHTRYRALYSASVNSYLAVKEVGGVKRKGPAADPWSEGDLRAQLSKNPQMTILSEAVLRLAVDGVPIAETIAAATDPRGFVTVIRVSGGGTWRGVPLGRVVRYYWSVDGDPILDGTRRVAKTEGARPLQELTSALPADLDRARYVAEAEKLARELAVIREEGLA